MNKKTLSMILSLVLNLAVVNGLHAGELASPEDFFGFQLGADRKIARWDAIVEYFEVLAGESDKVLVTDMGPTTNDHPFLLVVVSSADNLSRLERLREVNNTLFDAQGLDAITVDELVAEGKAVVCQSMSLHATEIGGTQMAPELVYDLLTRDDEETQRILDNVILLLIPSFNPDGQIMVTDWYNETLGGEYDVIILPHDQTTTMMGAPKARYDGSAPTYPPEYRSAIGDEGVAALKSFVEAGGTIVALGDATGFAIEKFELEVRNVIDELPATEFFCPGSTVKASFDNSHPLAYGMPDDGLVLFWGSPTFQIKPSLHNEWYETIVRYGDRDLLESGWLIGEEHIAGKAGMVAAKQGEGKVILIGFRTQNRAQTHGTFKLLFNTLLR